ncbi:protein FAM114A2 [Thalassophryne amazonica]|uniref:protein FAM114A2 n=1 Tax=Thalassophryne amazonica TaxID=390379 RepID=UPI001471AD0C|nr:protein FAM114A2 [Thalassophryne amazonica]XP_034033758.1 protein FAM114A2 [Thalassophryne amazonica]
MSDVEDSGTVNKGSEAVPEMTDASSVNTSESPSLTMPDDSSPDTPTDVAPTRKAKRRPDVTTEADVLGTPELEEQLAKTSIESSVAQGSWGYWGNWGKSIISTATATVATVGHGLTQVIEKAETSLGIPSPTELSARAEEEQKQSGEVGSETDKVEGDSTSAVGGAIGMLSSLTSVVQSTGKTVIIGGLDALEFIGKKTMDVIAEGDPGFKKTKGLMNRNATLSQVLREAKEREELQAAHNLSDSEPKLVAHYGVLFDEFQGLSHLEALEILSRDSKSKVKSVLTTLSGDELVQLRDELDVIKDAFSLVEFDDDDVDEEKDKDGSDFEKELTEALEGLSVSVTADKLSKACRSTYSHIASINKPKETEEEGENILSVEEVHVVAISSLAELTARSIELFHKLAEMILFCNSSTDASAVSQLTVVLCKEISLISKKFTSCLAAAGSNEKGDVLNPLITGVFLEASNSASYIQDAFQLLMPILEISHIQRRAEPIQQ